MRALKPRECKMLPKTGRDIIYLLIMVNIQGEKPASRHFKLVKT